MAKTPPASAGDAPTPEPETPPPAGLEPDLFWRYTGDVPRLYMDVPVTVEHGDVIAWPTEPGAHWEPAEGPATRLPDNATPPTVEE